MLYPGQNASVSETTVLLDVISMGNGNVLEPVKVFTPVKGVHVMRCMEY